MLNVIYQKHPNQDHTEVLPTWTVMSTTKKPPKSNKCCLQGCGETGACGTAGREGNTAATMGAGAFPQNIKNGIGIGEIFHSGITAKGMKKQSLKEMLALPHAQRHYLQ